LCSLFRVVRSDTAFVLDIVQDGAFGI